VLSYDRQKHVLTPGLEVITVVRSGDGMDHVPGVEPAQNFLKSMFDCHGCG